MAGMTEWNPIAHPGLRSAVERYRQEKGRDPREEQPDLDGDEAMLGVYMIMLGYPPEEGGTVLPFENHRKTNKGDSTG